MKGTAAPVIPRQARLAPAPRSWSDLLRAARDELPCIAMGDVDKPIRRLRGHTLERQWIGRTWEALVMLDSYGRACNEHGCGFLPHLTAYLSWPDAPVVIPASRYVPSDIMNNTPGFRKMRVFPVPREVSADGYVEMAEHIRIGPGKPPAPRMHFYDDTHGTGRIYVGYIGPHLKNRLTN